MSTFTELVNDKIVEYGLSKIIAESNDLGEPDLPPVVEGPINSDPNLEVGAGVEDNVYTKPYRSLADVIYKGLRAPWDSFGSDIRGRMEASNIGDVSDDNKAIAFFTLIENYLENPKPSNTFNGVVESCASIVEEDVDAVASGEGQTDATMPMAEPGLEPSPDVSPGTDQEPVFDMPYTDLAILLDGVVKIEFNDLESSQQHKILALQPESLKSDQQGVSLIKTIKSVVDERNGPEPEVDTVESGGGFGPAAG